MPILVESSTGYTLTTENFQIIKNYSYETPDIAFTSILQLTKGELPSDLSDFLKDVKDNLIVGDKRLVSLIENSSFDMEAYRKAKLQVSFNPPTILAHKISTITVGHYDNTDSILVRTYKALEDLDSNINLQCMRIREWYGFHFPELAHIIPDNLKYLKCIVMIKNKEKIKRKILADILSEELCEKVMEQAKISVGSEMTAEDIEKIQAVCKSVIKEFDFKNELQEFIVESTIKTMPNTCALVQSELLVCKLLAHAGSLSTLARAPASTIQIYGAEKAYFGAVKTKSDTPKYGIIYHAPILSESKMKGKVARILATLICLAVKVDYYGKDKGFGIKLRERLVKRVEAVERSKKSVKKVLKIGKHEFNNKRKSGYESDKRIKRD